MIRRLLSSVPSILVVVSIALAGPVVAQDTAATHATACREWHECRDMALDALARGEYERFHDLAWRTIQTGPARDPALMYLLARAQSLSGRSHDALVMLDRLADMGVATDAATNDEFRNVRTLREWPDLEAKLRALMAAGPKAEESVGGAPIVVPLPPPENRTLERAPTVGESAPRPSAVAAPRAPDRNETAPAPPPPPESGAAPSVAAERADATTAAVSMRHPAEDAVRVPDVRFRPQGLAYDAVSSRFVVADPAARKLVVLDERSHRALDLVRAASAGFGAIAAFEIDPKRGDLWVVSGGNGTDDPGAVLHKLQLVSGRPIARFPVPASLAAARFDDVAVTPAGTVLLLDAAGHRIVAFDPGSHAFTVAASIDVEAATSLAPADDRSVYVAYPDGIVHVELGQATTTPVQASASGALAHIVRIRWSRRSLIGLQTREDGKLRVIEVSLAGRRASVSELADPAIADPAAVALSGNDLYVLTRTASGENGQPEMVVQRIRLH